MCGSNMYRWLCVVLGFHVVVVGYVVVATNRSFPLYAIDSGII